MNNFKLIIDKICELGLEDEAIVYITRCISNSYQESLFAMSKGGSLKEFTINKLKKYKEFLNYLEELQDQMNRENTNDSTKNN